MKPMETPSTKTVTSLSIRLDSSQNSSIGDQMAKKRPTVKEKMQEERNWLLAFRNRTSIEFNIPLDIIAAYSTHTILTVKMMEEAAHEGNEGKAEEIVLTHISVWQNIFKHLGLARTQLLSLNRSALPQIREFIHRFQTEIHIVKIPISKKGLGEPLTLGREEADRVFAEIQKQFPGITRQQVRMIGGKKRGRVTPRS